VERMIACSGMKWALLCAAEEDREWMGWQRAGEPNPPCQLLITLIGIIS